MQSKSQRYTFYAISIVSIMAVTAAWLYLSDLLGFSGCVRYSGLTIPVALFFVAWVYPLKVFDKNETLAGMHREALQAAGLFIFTSIGMPVEEFWGVKLPPWGSVLVLAGAMLLAVLSYRLMLHVVSRPGTQMKDSDKQTDASSF